MQAPQELSLAHLVASGLFADVIAPPPGDKAYKIFRRLTDPHIAHVAPFVFRAEVDAYHIAVANPQLQPYVPHFFGTVKVSRVVGEDSTDVGGGYWLDLCYVMERLSPDPEERKFGSFFNSEEWHLMEPLEQVFEAAGIRHLGDASVLYWRTSRPILIDFATSDAAADHARIPYKST